jgi:hypothetical protein
LPVKKTTHCIPYKTCVLWFTPGLYRQFNSVSPCRGGQSPSAHVGQMMAISVSLKIVLAGPCRVILPTYLPTYLELYCQFYISFICCIVSISVLTVWMVFLLLDLVDLLNYDPYSVYNQLDFHGLSSRGLSVKQCHQSLIYHILNGSCATTNPNESTIFSHLVGCHNLSVPFSLFTS